MMSTFGSNSPFSTSGVLARPAGLPCGALNAAPGYMGLAASSPRDGFASRPSRPFGTAAVVAPPGWVSKEACVHPTHKEIPAGMDSVVDNTVRFKPLAPRHGKTREILPSEYSPTMRRLAPDLLATSKGLNTATLPIISSPERMGAVLSPYTPNAALYMTKYDPERRTAGFLRTPNALGGSAYVDEATST